MAAEPPGNTPDDETTRVCIKNVPPNFTETKLRSHLNANSHLALSITDCKVLRTKDGKSRKLAFVGFKDAGMAKHVISFFDKSFAATSRLTVEAAFTKSTKTSHRPWSKHSEGSSRYNALHNIAPAVEETKIPLDRDRQKESDEAMEKKKREFIDVMVGGKSSSSNLFWANDDGGGEKSPPVVQEKEKKSDEKLNSDSELDDSRSDNDDDSFDVMKTFKKDKVSDMDFLRSKVIGDKEDLKDDSSSAPSSSNGGSDLEDSSASDDDSVVNNQNKDKENDMKRKDFLHETEAPVALSKVESNPVVVERLFIRNLPFSATEDDIREIFSPLGSIVECHIPIDDTNRNKGYAFVKFSSSDEAAAAKENLDGTPFQGRLMHILPARQERENTDDKEANNTHMTHKMSKELERQKDAENKTEGWSSSFVRGDAVVDNLANRLGLDKGALLNVKDGLSSGNAAVRLALGETHLIEENRSYFKKHGVDMDALISSGKMKELPKRSSNMILVKNLPNDTSLDEISKVFLAVGGNTPTILLPPSKTIALIVYDNNNDAKKCFRKLAYKRFKHVPLYLEWAPMCTTLKKSLLAEPNELAESTSTSLLSLDPQNKVAVDEADEDATGEGNSTSIYVKNLNFSTSEASLKSVFKDCVGLRSVRIPTKVAPVKSAGGQINNEKLVKQSMGFGFVEFDSEASAKKAIFNLQGQAVAGHSLELKIAKGNSSSSKKTSSKKQSTKLIVRNVPFQASRTEILQLFGSFGQLKTVRLPKKFDGGHRGFAFVQFTGKKEALNAMKSLSQTHLYGRHLVLEWADDKDDIETLRDKAKRGLPGAGLSQASAQAPRNKKIRFD